MQPLDQILQCIWHIQGKKQVLVVTSRNRKLCVIISPKLDIKNIWPCKRNLFKDRTENQENIRFKICYPIHTFLLQLYANIAILQYCCIFHRSLAQSKLDCAKDWWKMQQYWLSFLPKTKSKLLLYVWGLQACWRHKSYWLSIMNNTTSNSKFGMTLTFLMNFKTLIRYKLGYMTFYYQNLKDRSNFATNLEYGFIELVRWNFL